MNKTFLFLTVFITGMSVMAVELTASRLLAPYFGTSLFVWTNLIGVVLLALSLGYWWGGKWADRNDGKELKKKLFLLIFLTGIFLSLIPVFGGMIFRITYQLVPRGSLSIFFPSLFSALILFALPLCFLGMVTPMAARVGIQGIDSAGQTVGSLYACSTAGSILGTFLPVFLTIPYLGSRETFYFFGGLLILLGALGFKRPMWFVGMLIPLALYFAGKKLQPTSRLAFEGESIYNYLRIRVDAEGNRQLLINEGIGFQSIYNPDIFMTGYYYDGATVLPALYPEAKNFLFVGLAGGTSARILARFFPNLSLEGVEIDPTIVELGKKFMGLDQVPVKVHLGDGRVFLERNEEKYDLIMVDVYRDNFSIPVHLATREFFDTLRRRLSERGAMMMNVFSPSSDSDLLRVLKNTLASAFPFVYEFHILQTGSLLFAFQEKPPVPVSMEKLPVELRPVISSILGKWKRVVLDPNAERELSLDNQSPVELLSAKAIFGKDPLAVPFSFSSPPK